MSKAVLILGMHRSGTSSLAGSLQEAGLYLGEVVTQAPHNAKGNRENRAIMALHDDVLHGSSGAWDCPPAAVRWSDEHRARRDAIVAAYGSRSPWGFKDPRTLLTLEGWLEVLHDVAFVGTFRHPWSVATSLLHRNRGSMRVWQELWAHYNARLLEYHDRYGFSLVCFDVTEAEYGRSIRRVALELGLEFPDAPSFFEPSLRHHRPAPGDVPAEAQRIYERLRERAAV